jgi:BirA family transcriptional regulator, biotin operon repressor / biotin---[acetyl-CoA-carboxylase] ligase
VTEFDAEAFDSQLTTAILGRRFTALDRVPSTQDLAREVAGESLRNPDGEVVLAEFQTQGRGRLRRAWSSPPNVNLLFSLILCPRARIARPTLITLLMGGSVREALTTGSGVAATLKWPNDVLIDGRKVAGILTEEGRRPDGRPFWVVGVGINVNGAREDLTGKLAHTATTVRAESGHETSREELLARLFAIFEERYGAMQRGELDDLLAWLRRRLGGMGAAVRVRVGDGEVTGAAAGLDDDGALVVRTSHGALSRVEAGDDVEWL